MTNKSFVYACLLTLLTVSTATAQKNSPLFSLMKPEATGLKFINKVREDDSLHVLVYEYLYNGHGIGVGDFDNDGWQDVFISGNTTPNKLFLNKGSFKFIDVTKDAAVAGNGTWSTGVSIADVNGDDLADIYVCHSGKYKDAKLSNELFINTGVVDGKPRFQEQAKLYGLDAPGTQSTQAAFFDYDRDGDLDMFLLNHSINTYYAFLNTRKQRATPDFRYGNRLFRHDKKADGSSIFTDVTLTAGIINNPLNYGLSVNISDLNEDGWPDIYTTSDYSEHDCYYVNNQNGTFTQSLQKSFAHISKFSMGADIADFNNDGLPDVLTLDMLPADNHRQKLLKGPDEYDAYHLLLDSGYYRQHMRNMLQLNRGNDIAGNVRFSEIGQLANVSNTDWSWSGLFADLDGDGWKDLLITNGYLRDFTDLDFLKYTMANAQLAAAAKGNLNFKSYSLVQKMPSNKLSNYLFQNKGDLTFQDVTKDWGFSAPAISNAAIYADLDNDGDLDVIIGNNNEPVMVWKNNVPETGHHWLQVKLKTNTGNTAAFGAKLTLYAGGTMQRQELYPVRGFQSCVTPIIYFGIKSATTDSLIVEWPSGKRSILRNVEVDKLLSLTEDTAEPASPKSKNLTQKTLFTVAPKKEQIDFHHHENDFIDFKVEVLIPYQLSKMGPALTTGDVNGDGNDDIFIGGAIGQSGQLYFQRSDGTFSPSTSQPWSKYIDNENVNALFFDADLDRDLDLYIVSGGNEYLDDSPELQDILYLNDGQGNFTPSLQSLPTMRGNKQAITTSDFDHDGDWDLFVGGRGKSGYFPESSRSYILRNNTQGNKVIFTDVTKTICPELLSPGMVTVAAWSDFDNDAFPELVIAGEWMPVMIFKNDKGKLSNIPQTLEPALYGLWSAIDLADLDGDGDKDIIAGNCGLNNQFKPSVKEPMTIHVSDFDGNGNIDPVLCYYTQGKSYPMASRDELLDQIPSLKKKYIKYTDYADVSLETIFSKEQLAKAQVYTCTETKSLILLNDGQMKFTSSALPMEAQFSKVQSIVTDDFDRDGKLDIVLTGNFFGYRTQLGDSDASLGLYLKGIGDGSFKVINPSNSGLFVDGDVRATEIIKNSTGQKKLIVVKNNDTPQIISINKHE
ncbi:VCBS repeat-containing protein [Ohtaekwangia koreensis]|uniref:Repeat domain-containing protein n=1 Tax=Ohtaekwangia koreensis TaxID=688867 RepID=A0A1T5JV04_9BACT|nr:FG-GAP-like repeat-containing protein [Ohtaekwangia koreensis]SKC55211.1 Repeat domain-containing protein [Ohtaekwangia koreensis]